MLHAFFSLASGFLYLGNILQGFARGILALRNLEIISSHLLPTLSSPSLPKLLEAPSAPLELPAVFRTLDPSGGLIAIEGPPPVLSAPIPTHSYQSSLEIVTPSNFPGLFLIFITFAIISGFVFLLPELVYIFTTISKIAFAFIHISSKFLGRFWIKSVPNLVPACPPLQLPSSQSLSSRSLITFVSLLLLWTGPPAAASVITFIWISQNFFLQHGSNVISNILQRCGLITETDTRTPHILNAIYEQITHGVAVYDILAWREDQLDEYNKEHTRVTMDLRVAHPYMGIQLENSEREPRGVLTQENQERDTFALELESENQRLRMQHICTVFVDSQKSLRRQLEVSLAREEKLRVDLFAAEQDRRRLKALISTLEASDNKYRGLEEIAVAAKARCANAEKMTNKLLVDLTATLDGAREIQDQLDHQTKLASEKDSTIQTITGALQITRAKLTDAEDEIARLVVELRREHDLRVHERKELLDEQFKIQSGHEAEMERIFRETESTYEHLNTLCDVLSRLHADGKSCAHPRHLRPSLIEPNDTGQPPPRLESFPDTGTLLSNSPDETSPLESSIPSRNTRIGRGGPSACQIPDLPQISACLGQVSAIAKAQRAAVEDLLEERCQLEFEHIQEVKSREDERHLKEELAVVKEQLRMTQDEVSNTRRDLDRSRETLREVATRAKYVQQELETCQAKLKDVQDARRAVRIKFVEAVELLRLRRTDMESLKTEVQATQFKNSQVTFLSAALRERVTSLEAEVKTLKGTQKRSTASNRRTSLREPMPTNFHSLYSANTASSHAESITHSADIQVLDSIYMTVSSSLSYLLESSLPPSSSQSSDFSMSIKEETSPHTSPSLHNVNYLPKHLDLSLARDLPPLSSSELLSPSSSHRSIAFLPAGNSVGSTDWPPVESAPLLSDGNAQQEDGTGTQYHPDNSILVFRTTPLSPLREDSADVYLDCTPPTSFIPCASLDPLDHSLAQTLHGRGSSSLSDPADIIDNHRASEFLPSYNHPEVQQLNSYQWDNVVNAPPNLIPACPPSLTLSSHEQRIYTLTSGREAAPPALRQCRGDVGGISMGLVPLEPPLRLLHSFPSAQDIELAQLRRSETAPTPLSQNTISIPPNQLLPSLPSYPSSGDHLLADAQKDNFMMSERHISLPVSQYNDANIKMDQISTNAFSWDPFTSASRGKVSTMAPEGMLLPTQLDDSAETPQSGTSLNSLAVAHVSADISVLAHRELSFELQSNDTDGALSSRTSSDASPPPEVQPSLQSLSTLHTEPDLMQQLELVPSSTPVRLQACSRESKHRGAAITSRPRIHPLNALSCRTPPGSPPLWIRVFTAFQNEATSSRSCRELPASEPNELPASESTATSSLAAPLPSVTSVPSPESCISRLPMLDCREAPHADINQDTSSEPAHPPTKVDVISSARMICEDVRSQGAKRATRPTLQPPLPRLLPGLLDPITIRENDPNDDDSPCIFGSRRLKKNRPFSGYRVYSRPRGIPTLDYGLPQDFVPGLGRVTTERSSSEFDDFATLIPLGCPTSTPIASRKQVLKIRSQTQEAGLASLGKLPQLF